MARSPQDSPASAAFAARLAKYAYSPAGPSTPPRPPRSAPALIRSARTRDSPPARGVARTPVRSKGTQRKRDSVSDGDGDYVEVDAEKKVSLLAKEGQKGAVKKPRPYAGPEVYEHLPPLPDRLRTGLDLVFCGINPGKMSSTLGHHFAHPTNKFWKALHLSGLTPRLYSPLEDALLPDELNYGLTNLCGRPTSEQSELSTLEMRLCVPDLTAKLNELRPKVVCFVGKKIWDTYESVAKKTAQPVLGHPAERNAGTHTKREIDHADPLGEGADRLESGTTPDIKLEEEPFTASSETAPRGLTPLRPSVALTSGGSPAQSAAGSPAQSAADDEVKPSLPVTPRDLPKRLPSTSRGSRSTVHEPIDWHTPRKIRLPHDDDAGLVTSYTYFWVTPSTSGLERTPLPDLVAVFASLRAFVETLKAGEGEQGEQGEWLDMDVPAMQRSVDAMKLAAANRARRKAG